MYPGTSNTTFTWIGEGNVHAITLLSRKNGNTVWEREIKSPGQPIGISLNEDETKECTALTKELIANSQIEFSKQNRLVELLNKSPSSKKQQFFGILGKDVILEVGSYLWAVKQRTETGKYSPEAQSGIKVKEVGKHACEYCKGTKRRECLLCGGRGRYSKRASDANPDQEYLKVPCDRCIDGVMVCNMCNGTGLLPGGYHVVPE